MTEKRMNEISIQGTLWRWSKLPQGVRLEQPPRKYKNTILYENRGKLRVSICLGFMYFRRKEELKLCRKSFWAVHDQVLALACLPLASWCFEACATIMTPSKRRSLSEIWVPHSIIFLPSIQWFITITIWYTRVHPIVKYLSRRGAAWPSKHLRLLDGPLRGKPR